MKNIVFPQHPEVLKEINRKLYRASQGRYELRVSKSNVLYAYDYDESEIIRNPDEITMILECMMLSKELERVRKDIKDDSKRTEG